MRTCTLCLRELGDENFSQEKTPDGRLYTRSVCRTCRNEQNRKREQKLRESWGVPAATLVPPVHQSQLPPIHPLELLLTERGLCRGMSDLFLPSTNGNSAETRNAYAVAKTVCEDCPVRAECRVVVDHIEADGLLRRNETGVWAGETPHERRERRKRERRNAQRRRHHLAA